MKTERVYLHEGNDKVYFDLTIPTPIAKYWEGPRPTIIILPGGGYGYCSDREAEPVSRAYLKEGFNTALLFYSTTDKVSYPLFDKEKDYSIPQFEVMKTIKLLRDNAEEWNVDRDRIIVIGFSAGGHLAASASILWDDKNIAKALGAESEYLKVNATILGYPVINPDKNTHPGTFQKLLGADCSDELVERYTLDKHITPETPPMFLFHTAGDKAVPIHNSCYIANKLYENSVPVELHVFPFGAHGMSVGTKEVLPEDFPYNARWVEWSVAWIKNILKI